MVEKVRDYLQKNPVVGVVITAAFVLGAVVYAVKSVGGRRYPLGVSDQAYYTTDEDAVGQAAVDALFVDDINKVPPFDHNGKPAVKAIVCAAGSQRWVNNLIRYLPGAKKSLEESAAKLVQAGVKTGPSFGEVTEGGYEVKRPGPGVWHRGNDPEAAKITSVELPPGVQARDVDVVTP